MAAQPKIFKVLNTVDKTETLAKAETRGQVVKFVSQSFVVEPASALDVAEKIAKGVKVVNVAATGEDGAAAAAASAKIFTVFNKVDNSETLVKAGARGQVNKFIAQSFVIEPATPLEVADKMLSGVKLIDATALVDDTNGTGTGAGDDNGGVAGNGDAVDNATNTNTTDTSLATTTTESGNFAGDGSAQFGDVSTGDVDAAPVFAPQGDEAPAAAPQEQAYAQTTF